MNIKKRDMNLLRLFEAVYRLGSVSRAAEALGLSQPAASQGLTRLRLVLGDALFTRSSAGMRPTRRAQRLAAVVQPAIAALEEVLLGEDVFDAARSDMTLRMHMSDIGEVRLLPELVAALHREAPRVRVQTLPLPQDQIADALHAGSVDFAFGFLPALTGTRKLDLLEDAYGVLVRTGHPLLATGKAVATARDLKRLEYVAVRSHSETFRILQQLDLHSRLVLTSAHFLALPAIIARTDLAVVMPCAIARNFMDMRRYSLLPVALPRSSFVVSMHWSQRMENDPAHQWLRGLVTRLFTADKPHRPAARPRTGP